MRSLARIALIPVICVLAVANGCMLDENSSAAVIKTKVCVLFREVQESGTFSSSVVSDLFRKRLAESLEETGLTLDDIQSVGMTGAFYKVVTLHGHDWIMSASVKVSRQDDPGQPPTEEAVLLNMTTASLRGLKGKPTVADLNADGVAVVDNALADVLNGEDPRLVLTMFDTDVDPAPSPEDPLVLKWLACIEFVASANASAASLK
jgi:hypothetical protein